MVNSQPAPCFPIHDCTCQHHDDSHPHLPAPTSILNSSRRCSVKACPPAHVRTSTLLADSHPHPPAPTSIVNSSRRCSVKPGSSRRLAASVSYTASGGPSSASTRRTRRTTGSTPWPVAADTAKMSAASTPSAISSSFMMSAKSPESGTSILLYATTCEWWRPQTNKWLEAIWQEHPQLHMRKRTSVHDSQLPSQQPFQSPLRLPLRQPAQQNASRALRRHTIYTAETAGSRTKRLMTRRMVCCPAARGEEPSEPFVNFLCHLPCACYQILHPFLRPFVCATCLVRATVLSHPFLRQVFLSFALCVLPDP